MTDTTQKRNGILASTSSKITASLVVFMVVASIPMIIASAQSNKASSASSTASRLRSTQRMPSLTSKTRSTLSPGQSVQIVLQVTSVQSADLLKGRVLHAVNPTTLTGTSKTVQIKVQPAATISMGTKANIKRGELLQANGTVNVQGILQAHTITVLSGYAHLR